MPGSQGQAAGESLALYAGRWVAISRGRVVGQGGTPEQALLSAARIKDPPQVIYVPTPAPLSFSPLLDEIAAIVPASTPLYLVGGAVRDALLGRTSHDLDFAVAKHALSLGRRVANALNADYFTLDEERETARVIVTLLDGERFVADFATFRGGTLETDLAGRDFTINALAVAAHEPQKLFDPLGGASDLRAKQLRVCSPTAMADDPIRVLRGVRQAASLGFKILPETRALMKAAVPALATISPERLRDEAFKILDGPHPDACLRALDLLGALPHLFPELPALKNEQQSPPHTTDVWNHTLSVLHHLEAIFAALAPTYDADKAANLALGLLTLRLGRFRQPLASHLKQSLNVDRPLRPLIFLAALYHDIEKPHTRSYDYDKQGQAHFFQHDERGAETAAQRGRELHLSNPEIERLKTIVRHHMRPFHLGQNPQPPTPRAIYRFFRETGPAGVDICLLSLADFLATYGVTLSSEAWAHHLDVIRLLLEAWFEHHEHAVAPPPLVSGDDLMAALQLQPGRQLGQLLEAIREAQAAGQVHTRDEALALARQMLETPS